jgi:hypothetical protein
MSGYGKSSWGGYADGCRGCFELHEEVPAIEGAIDCCPSNERKVEALTYGL